MRQLARSISASNHTGSLESRDIADLNELLSEGWTVALTQRSAHGGILVIIQKDYRAPVMEGTGKYSCSAQSTNNPEKI